MDRNLLVNELQSLVVESKRKYPDVKEAAERALLVLKTTTGSHFTPDARQVLLLPVLGGCKTKVAKIVAISIGALQRLVSLQTVGGAAIPALLQTLQSVVNQGVEIQLRIVQTLLLMMTYCSDVHRDVLGELLSLYFKLQDSKTSVVSSTASASLRQAMVLVFERVQDEGSEADTQTSAVTLTDGSLVNLNRNEWDAYHLFDDLCTLTAKSVLKNSKNRAEHPRLLKISSITPTFGLELIESILSGFAKGFRSQKDLISLLQERLSPLLETVLVERAPFPVMLRTVRVVFLLLRYFFEQIPTQAKAFWQMLIRGACNEADLTGGRNQRNWKIPTTTPPLWLRAMLLEVLKALCRDASLLSAVWQAFDAGGECSIYGDLVFAVRQIVTEKPAELGINETMQGIGTSHLNPDHSVRQGGYLDMGLNAVSSAATAGVSTVSAMIGTEGEGKLDASCGIKTQCIEQHDKIDPNPIPDRYPYLLALDMLVEITDGLAVGLYAEETPTVATPEHAKDEDVVDLSDPSSEMVTGSFIKPMLNVAWPALLASLAFVMGTNVSDDLFERVIKTFKTLIAISDATDLVTGRDAFLNTLSRFAVPAAVVKAAQVYTEPPPTPGIAGSDTFKVNNSSITAKAPALSERNLTCLTALMDLAEERGDSLCSAWHDILETVQNANFVLGKQAGLKRVARNHSDSAPSSPRFSTSSNRPNANTSQPSQVLFEAEPSSVQGSIYRLMAMTSRLSDGSFQHVLSAICRLSGETIGLGQTQQASEEAGSVMPGSPAPRSSALGGTLLRRSSGLAVSQTIRQGERSFALMMLDVAVSANLERIITQPTQTAWNIIVTHVIDIAQHQATPAVIRMQAAEALGNLLNSATTNLEILDIGVQSRLQQQVFEALSQQVRALPSATQNATDLEIRTRGLTTLSTILESSGHTIASVWPAVFRIIDSVFSATPEMLAKGGSQASKAQTNLIRTAYPSLNLACSDYLSTFDAIIAEHCLDSLCNFASQQFDMNIALSSIGSIWNLMDAFQSGLIDIPSEDRNRLWLRSLDGMLMLTNSRKSEVRASAVQTMFRSLETHGSNLTSPTWNAVITRVLLPLLNRMVSTAPQGRRNGSIAEDDANGYDIDESHTLALTSIRAIHHTYASLISTSPDYLLVVQQALAVTLHACTQGGSKTCSAALRLSQQLVLNFGKSAASSLYMSATWSTIEGIHNKLEGGQDFNASGHKLTQDSLLEYVRLLEVVVDAAPGELSEAQMEMLLRASRSAITYTHSPTYPLDGDIPSALQQAGLDLLCRPRLQERCPAGLIISALAEYVTLAFVGGFDYVDTSMPGAKRTITKTVCYVGLAKATMVLIVTFVQGDSLSLKAAVRDGSIERLIGALALPIKLRLDCPPANKFGKDLALWKTATFAFVEVIKRTIPLLETVPPGDIGSNWDSLWQQIVATFRSILLTDDSYMTDMEMEEAEKEELCDMAAIELIETSVKSMLGHPRMTEAFLAQFADLLYQASVLYMPYAGRSYRAGETDIDQETSVSSLPRQDLRYRCLGLLFDSVGKGIQDHAEFEARQRRTATAMLPLLLSRCKGVLTGYLASASLRGSYPFERVREEELAYVVRRLLDLKLWSGSFDSMQATAPETQSNAIGEALRQSSRAHLFHLYPILLELVASPLRLPVIPVRVIDVAEKKSLSDETTIGDPGAEAQRHATELDVRKLARACLDALGKEMGV